MSRAEDVALRDAYMLLQDKKARQTADKQPLPEITRPRNVNLHTGTQLFQQVSFPLDIETSRLKVIARQNDTLVVLAKSTESNNRTFDKDSIDKTHQPGYRIVKWQALSDTRQMQQRYFGALSVINKLYNKGITPHVVGIRDTARIDTPIYDELPDSPDAYIWKFILAGGNWLPNSPDAQIRQNERLHENRILRLYQWYATVEVQDYQNGGDWGNLFNGAPAIDQDTIIKTTAARFDSADTRLLCFQLLQGMESMHYADFVHLDVKPANATLSIEDSVRETNKVYQIGDYAFATTSSREKDVLQAKFIDFEFGQRKSMRKQEDSVNWGGTYLYFAPEKFLVPPNNPAGRYGKSGDIFAMGQMFVSAIVGEDIFNLISFKLPQVESMGSTDVAMELYIDDIVTAVTQSNNIESYGSDRFHPLRNVPPQLLAVFVEVIVTALIFSPVPPGMATYKHGDDGYLYDYWPETPPTTTTRQRLNANRMFTTLFDSPLWKLVIDGGKSTPQEITQFRVELNKKREFYQKLLREYHSLVRGSLNIVADSRSKSIDLIRGPEFSAYRSGNSPERYGEYGPDHYHIVPAQNALRLDEFYDELNREVVTPYPFDNDAVQRLNEQLFKSVANAPSGRYQTRYGVKKFGCRLLKTATEIGFANNIENDDEYVPTTCTYLFFSDSRQARKTFSYHHAMATFYSRQVKEQRSFVNYAQLEPSWLAYAEGGALWDDVAPSDQELADKLQRRLGAWGNENIEAVIMFVQPAGVDVLGTETKITRANIREYMLHLTLFASTLRFDGMVVKHMQPDSFSVVKTSNKKLVMGWDTKLFKNWDDNENKQDGLPLFAYPESVLPSRRIGYKFKRLPYNNLTVAPEHLFLADDIDSIMVTHKSNIYHLGMTIFEVIFDKVDMFLWNTTINTQRSVYGLLLNNIRQLMRGWRVNRTYAQNSRVLTAEHYLASFVFMQLASDLDIPYLPYTYNVETDSRCTPFDDMKTLFEQKTNDGFSFKLFVQRAKKRIWRRTRGSLDVLYYIMRCICADPVSRMDADELLQLEVFAEMDVSDELSSVYENTTDEQILFVGTPSMSSEAIGGKQEVLK